MVYVNKLRGHIFKHLTDFFSKEIIFKKKIKIISKLDI